MCLTGAARNAKGGLERAAPLQVNHTKGASESGELPTDPMTAASMKIRQSPVVPRHRTTRRFGLPPKRGKLKWLKDSSLRFEHVCPTVNSTDEAAAHHLLALVLVLAVPTTAAARVRLVRVTPPIGAGSYAHLTASVSPSRTCSISVSYKSGRSHAAGLYPKRPTGGRVSWTWKGRSERRSS